MVELQMSNTTFVRRPAGQRMSPRFIQCHRGYPVKVMFWGCISIYGPGCLVPVEGNMDSDKYVGILKSSLLPVAEAWFGDEEWFFQQDNARCHTSRKTHQHMQSMDLQTLDWPPNSADLNCIENVWAFLKKKVRARLDEAHDRLTLIQLCLDIWNNDVSFIDMCRNVVLSMPNRLSALRHSRGSSTDY